MSPITRALWLVLALASVAPAALARAPETFLDQVGFTPQLGKEIPLDAALQDEHGASVRLGDYFRRAPVVLVLAYYRCDNLCGVVLSGVVEALRQVSFDAGRAFQVVVVSIDATEPPALARAAKDRYLARYSRPGAAQGWHFLTGGGEAASAIARAIGFRYYYDAGERRYAHPAGITILTPQGRVSSYLYGVQFAARDLRLGLVDAAAERLGSVADQLLLLCYHYDPTRGKYGVVIMDVLRIAGIGTVAALAIFLGTLLRRDRR